MTSSDMDSSGGGVGQCWGSSGDDNSSLVDGSVSWVFGLNSWFVGLDVSSESSCVGYIVDNTLSSISYSQAIRAGNDSIGTGFLAKCGTRSVTLVVTEGVVAKSILASVLGTGSSSDKSMMEQDCCLGSSDKSAQDEN
ncbi:hypothetical protein X975_14332, partial [Stegodyphus mimosarum]